MLFSDPDKFVDYIQKIPCDSIVTICTIGTPYSIINNGNVKRAIMTVGSCLINTLKPGQSWALVGVKGSAPGKAEEKIDADISYNIPSTKMKFTTTVSAISTRNYAEISVEGTAYKTEEEESLLVVVLDENSLEKLLHKEYNRESLNDFVENISSLEYGKIVAVALNGNLDLTAEVIETCEIIGSSKSDQIEEGKSWTIIGYKGASQDCMVEVLSEANQPAECLALLPVDPLCCDGVSIISSTSADSMSDSTFVSIGGIDVSESLLSQEKRGIGLIVIKPSSGVFEEKKMFNIHDREEEASDLVQFVQKIPFGKIVAGFLNGKGDFKYLTDKAKRVLQQIGSTKIWKVSENSSWAIVGRKGCAPISLPEIHRKDGVVAVQLTCQFMTCLFATPFYSLYATSKGMACGSSASICMENSFILNPNETKDPNETKNGLHVAVLDNEDYDVQHLKCFDTSSSKSESEEFAKFITEQCSGSILIVVVSKEASQNLTDSAKEIIVSLGSNQIHELRDGGSWCLISAKDCPGVCVEALSNTTTAHCHMCLPICGVNTNQTYTMIKAQSQRNLGKIAIGTKVQSSNFPNTITLATVDPVLWQIEDADVFFYNSECVQKLESKLSKVPSGKLVVAAGCGDISKHFTEQSMHAMESIGSGLVQSINKDNSWALVGIKGAAPGSVCESLENNAVVSLCVTCPTTNESNTDASSMAENTSSEGSTKPPSSSSSGIPSIETLTGDNSASVSSSTEPSTNPPSGPSREITRKVLLVGISYEHTIQKEYCTLANQNSSLIFLFYFFGHGRQDRIIALNNDGDYPNEITREEFMELLEDFPEDCNITLIIHSCRSGGMFEGDPRPLGFAFSSCSALVECSLLKNDTNPENFTTQLFEVIRKKGRLSYTTVHNVLKEVVKDEKHKIDLSGLSNYLQSLLPTCSIDIPNPETTNPKVTTEFVTTIRLRMMNLGNDPINNTVEVMLPLRKENEAHNTNSLKITDIQCYMKAKSELKQCSKRIDLKYVKAVNINEDTAQQRNIIGVATFTYEAPESFPEDIAIIIIKLSHKFHQETNGEIVINQIVLNPDPLDFDSTPKMFWNREINDPNMQYFLEPHSV